MAKSVTGTPIRSISAGKGQGHNSKIAQSGTSTVQPGYRNGPINTNDGPPLNNRSVNDDAVQPQTRLLRGEHNSLNAINKNGTVFDIGLDRGNAPLYDSPVPTGAQVPLIDQTTKADAMTSGGGNHVKPNDGFGNVPRGVLATK